MRRYEHYKPLSVISTGRPVRQYRLTTVAMNFGRAGHPLLMSESSWWPTITERIEPRRATWKYAVIVMMASHNNITNEDKKILVAMQCQLTRAASEG